MEKILNFIEDNSEEKLESYVDEHGNRVYIKKNIAPSEIDENSNIATQLEKQVLDKLKLTLLENICSDYDSASDWRNQLRVGINELGLLKRPGSPEKPSVYSSSYKKMFLTTLQILIGEFFPSKDWVKENIYGKITPEIEKTAERKTNFFNFYLKHDYDEFEEHATRAIMWSIIAGSGFVKVEQDTLSEIARPIITNIEPYNLIVNNTAESLSAAFRITIKKQIDRKKFVDLQNKNFYSKNVKLSIDNDIEDNSLLNLINKINGINKDSLNDNDSDLNNQVYHIYECHTYLNNKDLNISENEEYKPYVITLDCQTGDIVRIEKNWDDNDPEFKSKVEIVQLPYLPGFGLYGLGISQICSNEALFLSNLKALLVDGARMSSQPGGFIPAGLKTDDKEIKLEPLTYKRIDTQGLPVRDVFDTVRVNEPSPILKALIDDMENNISEISQINNTPLSDINSNVPASTTLAILEQNQKLQTSIIKRIYKSFTKIYKLMDLIFSKYLKNETYPYEILSPNENNDDNEYLIKDDFKYDISIIPVANPNESSSYLKIIKSEQLLQLATQFPDLYNLYEVNYRFLDSIGIDNIDNILINPEVQLQEAENNAVSADPISENAAILNGFKLKVTPDQDHEAHIICHNNLISSLDPNLYEPIISQIKLHIMEHEKTNFELSALSKIGVEEPIEYLLNKHELLPNDFNEIIERNRQVFIDNIIAKDFADQIMQANQEMANIPPPLLPEEVMLQDVQTKKELGLIKAQSDANKNQIELEKAKLKADVELQKAEIKAESEHEKIESDILKARLDNEIDKSKLQTELQKVDINKNVETSKLNTDLYKINLDNQIEESKIKKDILETKIKAINDSYKESQKKINNPIE